jgi:hypothetical protein
MKKFILKSSAIIFAIIFEITYLSNAAQPTWTKIDTKNRERNIPAKINSCTLVLWITNLKRQPPCGCLFYFRYMRC